MGPFFGVFAGVFEGGFGKSGVKLVVFCGENVVECVANMVLLRGAFWGRKIGQVLEVYFWNGRVRVLDCGRMQDGWPKAKAKAEYRDLSTALFTMRL